MITKSQLQSISPGLTEQDIVASGSDNELVALMPKLKPEDVYSAVMFVITQPENVQVFVFVQIF